jgi:hypothetical protein
MARDYKHSAAKKKSNPRPVGSWVSFISGLGVGLAIAIGAFVLRLGPLDHANPAAEITPETDDRSRYTGARLEAEMERPEREFTFHHILPEIEVRVPDWKIAKPEVKPETTEAPDTGTYVIQVGSFKEYDDADSAKAALALRGIGAKIHRVVINGQDVWYRVHVGPFVDLATTQAMRAKLNATHSDNIVLKIGEGAG